MSTTGGAHVRVRVPRHQSVASKRPGPGNKVQYVGSLDGMKLAPRSARERTSLQARLTLTEVERVTGISESVFSWFPDPQLML
jgi:hypothetical protein